MKPPLKKDIPKMYNPGAYILGWRVGSRVGYGVEANPYAFENPSRAAYKAGYECGVTDRYRTINFGDGIGN